MIYLDNNATTRPLDEVIEAMSCAATERYANASSVAASMLGVDRIRVEAAQAVCKLLNAEEPDCFYFTSCATESNNWVFGPIVYEVDGRTVVISEIEHASVIAPAQRLPKDGFCVVEAKVTKDGVIDVGHFA